jgi:hypothetical protein
MTTSCGSCRRANVACIGSYPPESMCMRPRPRTTRWPDAVSAACEPPCARTAGAPPASAAWPHCVPDAPATCERRLSVPRASAPRESRATASPTSSFAPDGRRGLPTRRCVSSTLSILMVAAASRHRSAEPSTGQSRSPASSIAPRACLPGYGPFPRARIHPPASRGLCRRACRDALVRAFLFLAWPELLLPFTTNSSKPERNCRICSGCA